MSSSAPRGWPGVTVPADYYDGEIFAPAPGGEPTRPRARPTYAARRPHPRLMASSFAAFGAYTLLYLPAFGDTEGLRLIVMAGVLILGSLHHRKDVVMADAGATLLVYRRTASPEANAPIEVTRDQIVCVRPRSTNKLVRLFRSEMWQVGPERIIVSDSTSLTPLLQRLTQEGPPS